MQAWYLFSIIWFICLAPLISIFIARISKGFQIRQILIGTLALPVALTLISLCHFSLGGTFHHSATQIIIIVSISGLLLLLPLLLNHQRFSDAQYAYLPQEGLSKHRDYHSFITETMRHTMYMFLLFLTVGINGLAFFFFSFNFLNIVVLPIGCVFILVYLCRRRKVSL